MTRGKDFYLKRDTINLIKETTFALKPTLDTIKTCDITYDEWLSTVVQTAYDIFITETFKICGENENDNETIRDKDFSLTKDAVTILDEITSLLNRTLEHSKEYGITQDDWFSLAVQAINDIYNTDILYKMNNMR